VNLVLLTVRYPEREFCVIVPLLILLIIMPSYEQAIGQKFEGQWVHLKGSWQWEAITRDESVEADVLHLCDNGKFTWMTFTLYRSAGKISISADRGLCIYKGNCWDNAAMESFFSTLKTELVYHRNYESRAEA
jgi:hypothetical protein